MISIAGLGLQTCGRQALTSSRHQSPVSCSHAPPNVCLLQRALDKLLAHTTAACAAAHHAHIYSSAPKAHSGKIGASHDAVSLACTPPARLETCACPHGQQTRKATQRRRGDYATVGHTGSRD